MSSKPVFQKLRIQEGSSLLVLNPPDAYKKIIGALPDNVEMIVSPTTEVDFVHLFALNKAELEKFIDVALERVKYDGLLWISYPKGSSGVETDINRDSIWELMKEKGISPVTQVSIDDTWSALRFRPKDRVGK